MRAEESLIGDLDKLPAILYKARLVEGRQFSVVNGLVEPILGCDADALLADSLQFILHVDHVKVQRFFQNLASTGATAPDEYELSFRVQSNGRTIWLTDRGRKQFCEGSQTWVLHGIMFDNTEAIESERQIESILTHRTQEFGRCKSVARRLIGRPAVTRASTS